MLKREDFRNSLLKGPVASDTDDVMINICDGSKTFNDNDGALFSNKRNLGVLMNVNWFNPFRNREYYAVYLVIIKLPRNIRFKWEDVILIGLIAGPSEPQYTINSYIKPIADELLECWEGVILNEGGAQSLYKFVLIYIFSDVPATRNLGGFIAQSIFRFIFFFYYILLCFYTGFYKYYYEVGWKYPLAVKNLRKF